jgi:hypothetical protein
MSASHRTTAAVVVAAVIILLAGCRSGHRTSASTAPPGRPSASAGPSCPPDGGTCLGDLAAGTHATATFQPAITYTVPAGWTNGLDLPSNVLLSRATDPVEDFYGGNGIEVMGDVAAAAQNCDETAEPGVGRTADQLARWVAGLPGVQAGSPRPAAVGGLSGFVVDLRLVDTWTKTCPFADEPVVPLMVVGDPAQFHPTRTFIAKGMSLRLYLLDRPDGGNLLINVVDIPDGIGFQDYLEVAAPIVNSMRIGK